MNYMGVTPTRTRPISYNPLRAGQFRGYRGCNVIPSRTTIVNNNFVNYQMPSVNCNYAYQDPGMSSGMKWMLGLGLGTSILGSILSFFGVGNNSTPVDGQGGEAPAAPPANDQSQQIAQLQERVETLEDQLANSQTTQPATTQTEPAVAQQTTEQDNKPKTDYSNFKNGAAMVCRDASGKTASISGTLSDVQLDANGVPQSFTLTDSGSKNRYKYTVSANADGSLNFTCVSKNDQATIGSPNYTYTNGELVQENNSFNGYGIGIRTATKPAAPQNDPPKPASNEPPEGTMKDVTSNFFTAETPFYNVKDGKYHSTPDQEHSWMNPRFNQAGGASKPETAPASNEQVKLEYKYYNHRGHFYANGKEITQQEYRELKKAQENA